VVISCDGILVIGEVQDFQGFYSSSRVRTSSLCHHGYVLWLQFWRIVIADNYGAEITSFHGLQFYGVGKSCKRLTQQVCIVVIGVKSLSFELILLRFPLVKLFF